MGKDVAGRFKWEGTCVYLWLIHDDVWQKSSQYSKVTIFQLKIKLNLKKEIGLFNSPV